MDTMSWKARVKSGRQPLVEKWIDFLRANKKEGEKTLKNKEEHLEVYFMQQGNEAAYLYLFVLADDLEYVNQVTQSSGSPLGAKHFEYMMACADPGGCVQLKPELAPGDMSVFA